MRNPATSSNDKHAEPSTEKVQLVTLLASAYSGSTLLGLLLGQHPDVLCLGEVKNHQNDYRPDQLCTCGELLEHCPFWSKINSGIKTCNERWARDFRFDGCASAHPIDRKGGGWKKLFTVIGLPLGWIYGERELEAYVRTNAVYLKFIDQHAPETILLDLSKPPERLELLLRSEELDIRCIQVTRDPFAVFGSTIKRPRISRAKFGFKILREAIWLNMRMRHQRKAFEWLKSEQRISVALEDLIRDPQKSLNLVFDWLGLERIEANGRVDIRKQHIFVGNRWLFEAKDPEVQVSAHRASSALTPNQKRIFKWVSKAFGNPL